MCGIAGILTLGSSEAPSRVTLERMGHSVSHRGPDEQGSWLGRRIGLTARRLRIVDLVGGQQPLSNEDGSLRLVANGEIYNAGRLREHLERQGHVFATR